MRWLLLPLVGALCILSILPIPSAVMSQQEPAEAWVKVVSPKGAPLANAQLLVFNYAAATAPSLSFTDESGVAKIRWDANWSNFTIKVEWGGGLRNSYGGHPVLVNTTKVTASEMISHNSADKPLIIVANVYNITFIVSFVPLEPSLNCSAYLLRPTGPPIYQEVKEPQVKYYLLPGGFFYGIEVYCNGVQVWYDPEAVPYLKDDVTLQPIRVKFTFVDWSDRPLGNLVINLTFASGRSELVPITEHGVLDMILYAGNITITIVEQIVNNTRVPLQQPIDVVEIVYPNGTAVHGNTVLLDREYTGAILVRTTAGLHITTITTYLTETIYVTETMQKTITVTQKTTSTEQENVIISSTSHKTLEFTEMKSETINRNVIPQPSIAGLIVSLLIVSISILVRSRRQSKRLVI